MNENFHNGNNFLGGVIEDMRIFTHDGKRPGTGKMSFLKEYLCQKTIFIFSGARS